MNEKQKFDDLTKVEGVRDFLRDEVYSDIYNYIRTNHLEEESKKEELKRVMGIVDLAESLPSIYLNDEISIDEKNEQINNAVRKVINMVENLSSSKESLKEIEKTKDTH